MDFFFFFLEPGRHPPELPGGHPGGHPPQLAAPGRIRQGDSQQDSLHLLFPGSLLVSKHLFLLRRLHSQTPVVLGSEYSLILQLP